MLDIETIVRFDALIDGYQHKFVVPVLQPEKQAEIGNLVRRSLDRQRESKQLLDQTKSRVEQLIEEAVQA